MSMPGPRYILVHREIQWDKEGYDRWYGGKWTGPMVLDLHSRKILYKPDYFSTDDAGYSKCYRVLRRLNGY